MKIQLTHYTRFIPAKAVRASIEGWIKLCLWGSIIILLVLNVTIRFGQLPIIQITNSIHSHVSYAGMLWRQGQVSLAKDELLKINTFRNTNVLGETTNEPSPLSAWQKKNDALQNQLTYWESIASNHPEYRDAYLAMAQLGYVLNNPKMVSENIRKAALLDPNGTTIKIFENLAK